MLRKFITAIYFISTICVVAHTAELDLSNQGYQKKYLIKVLPPEQIKAIRDPEFRSLPEAINQGDLGYMNDDHFVMILNTGNEFKIYPQMPLIWHEIINDNLGDKEVAVSYCVLTGSGIVFSRKIRGDHLRSFGVSGYLYQSNLVMYDYQTRSTWSQLAHLCSSGKEKSAKLDLIPFIWAKFSYAKEKYPDAQILLGSKTMLNFRKMYRNFPFTGLDQYAENDSLRFPVPKRAMSDSSFAVKDLFIYFPEENLAISFKNLKKASVNLADVIYDKRGEVVAVYPKENKPFITLYWFALKSFFPNAKIL